MVVVGTDYSSGFFAGVSVSELQTLHRLFHSGVGSLSGPPSISGVWSPSKQDLHINLLVLRTVLLALQQFVELVKGKSCWSLWTT